jgi:hypothetical protein
MKGKGEDKEGERREEKGGEEETFLFLFMLQF